MVGAVVGAFLAAGSTVNAADPSMWGVEKGDWEFTLGGGGNSSNDFDANAGNFNASLGYFLTEPIELVLRQNLGFASTDEGGSTMFATRAAVDYHLKLGQKFRPYLGASIGGIYGDDVDEAFSAGLEGGVKYYVLPKTFLFGHFEYQWSLDDDDSGDSFEDGSFIYGVGVGFHF